MTYEGLNDEQASAQRMADKGVEWKMAWAVASYMPRGMNANYLQALHDRDRFHRDAQYWREECIRLTGEALA